MDALYVTKGAKVRLVRGCRVDSSNGPVESGPTKVQATDEKSGRPLNDENGDPILIDNPKPAPEGVVFGPPDGHGSAPVKFPSGAWGMVRPQDLELVEAAAVDLKADPVVRRAAEVASMHAKADAATAAIAGAAEAYGALAARVDGMQQRIGQLENAIDVLSRELAAQASATEQGQTFNGRPAPALALSSEPSR